MSFKDVQNSSSVVHSENRLITCFRLLKRTFYLKCADNGLSLATQNYLNVFFIDSFFDFRSNTLFRLRIDDFYFLTIPSIIG